MRIKKCKICGKSFLTKSDKKEYCSKACKQEAREIRRREYEQPCWHCKNCGYCSWSKSLIPIKHWIAYPTLVQEDCGDFYSYKIQYCPEYVEE